MPELIDRDALMQKICGNECGSICDEECENALCNFYDYIMDAPTIEAEPVRHGDWNTIYSYDGDAYFRCSNCEEEWAFDDGNPKSNGWKYCPNCGAKMYQTGGTISKERFAEIMGGAENESE